MCYHWRVIFKTCGHYVWGGIAKACEVEKKFDKEEADEGCSEMWSHTVCTIIVKPECDDCVEKYDKIEKKFDAVKDIIDKLRANLAQKVAKSLPVDAPGIETPEELRALGVSLDLEDLDGERSDDVGYETMSEIDLDEFDYIAELRKGRLIRAPSFSSTESSSSEDEVRPMAKKEAAEKRKVVPVKPDPNHRPLYLPILAQMPGGMREIMLDQIAKTDLQEKRWLR
jgi:hypothetical protein